MAALKLVTVGLYLFDPILDGVRHALADITCAELLQRIGLPECQALRVCPYDFQIINIEQTQWCPHMVKRM